MGIDRLEKNIPKVISGFVAIEVILFMCRIAGLRWYIPNSPCGTDVSLPCIVDMAEFEIVGLLILGFVAITVVLLLIQLMLHLSMLLKNFSHGA